MQKVIKKVIFLDGAWGLLSIQTFYEYWEWLCGQINKDIFLISLILLIC